MTLDDATAEATEPTRSSGPTGPRGPRPGSGAAARVLAGLFALLATPAGLLLVTWGAIPWRRAIAQTPVDLSLFAAIPPGSAPQLLIGLGIGTLLLLAVAASGILSSAGPLVGALWGVVPVVLGAVPMLLVTGYEMFGWGWLPLSVLETLHQGHGLLVPALLAGMGISLAIARRRPAPPLLVSLLGLVLVPLLLIGALVLALQGHARGVALTLQTLEAGTGVLPSALLLFGVLLLVLAPALTAWSPYAEVLPALALLVLSIALMAQREILFSLPMVTGPSAWFVPLFLLSGGLVLVALLLLTHTVSLQVVRRRSRRR